MYRRTVRALVQLNEQNGEPTRCFAIACSRRRPRCNSTHTPLAASINAARDSRYQRTRNGAADVAQRVPRLAYAISLSVDDAVVVIDVEEVCEASTHARGTVRARRAQTHTLTVRLPRTRTRHTFTTPPPHRIHHSPRRVAVISSFLPRAFPLASFPHHHDYENKETPR